MQRAWVWRQRGDFSSNPQNFEEEPWASCTAKMPEPNTIDVDKKKKKKNASSSNVITQQGSDTEVMNIKLKCSVNWAFPGVTPASRRQDNCLSVITGLELIKWNGMGY